MKEVSGRRSFFTTLASVAGLAAVRPGGASAQAPSPSAGPFDMAWLEQMKGKHKQLYDLGGISLAEEGRPLRFCKNFLDTFHDVYKLEHPDINSAVGVSGPAFPLNASDRLWEKYKLGERAKIVDPMTKQPSVRNVFYEGSDISVKAMQARGTIFWQCNVALGNVAQQLADQFKMPLAEVRADLIAGLNPGVKLMPSHVMALALAQEKGFTYMRP
jgi:intracellular sulfur oxidation DsrE/DsrF family protein